MGLCFILFVFERCSCGSLPLSSVSCFSGWLFFPNMEKSLCAMCLVARSNFRKKGRFSGCRG